MLYRVGIEYLGMLYRVGIVWPQLGHRSRTLLLEKAMQGKDPNITSLHQINARLWRWPRLFLQAE